MWWFDLGVVVRPLGWFVHTWGQTTPEVTALPSSLDTKGHARNNLSDYNEITFYQSGKDVDALRTAQSCP